MLTYGFYNSVNKDRKYDAEQIGAMFDGLINDGIYANYKEAMKIVPGSGHRHIVIRPGRAWFNGTWTLIDDGGHSFYIAGSQVTTTYYIYLCVSKNDRVNSIAYYNEIRENEPDKGRFFYLMGQITIPAGVNAITEDMIVDLRGSTHCPFVTGILETADFEQIVRETCSENWLVWLNSYEEGLDAKMNQIKALADKANTSADLAIATVQNLRHLAYRWAKYHAILVQGGSLAWVLAIDTPDSYGEPPKRILYRGFAFDGVNCTLSDPVSTTGISAADQYDNYRSAPYFNGDGYGGTVAGQIYRYERMTKNVKMSGNSVTITYGYRVSRAKIVKGAYKPGSYIETVEAKYASEYPLDGYKDGYWYTRFASRASDVFFDNTGLTMSARTVQEAIMALYKTGGPGTVVEKFSGDAFEGYDKFYDSVARMRVNPYEPLNIETYDGSGQLTHPGVRYFPDGWCGHKYWMVATPYPNSALELENPCVWYSDDGYTWSAEGIPNPLDLPLMVDGAQASMNSDPHLLLRPDGVMEVWWRTNYWENSGEGLYTVVYRRTSTDGTNWTDKEELYRALTGGSDGIVCPVVMHEDGVYKIWAVSDQESLRYYESTTGTDWERIRDIDVSNPDYPEYKVWHFDINHTAKGYEFVGNYGIPGDHTSYKYLYYAVSQDNVTYSRRVMILSRGPSGNFDERLLYRPTIVRLDNKVMVYYGANNSGNEWHVGQIEAPSAYLFNAVLIGGERLKAIESKNAQQDGRIGALEAGGVKAAEGQTIVQSFDVSPWLEGYWKPESNGELTLYGNFHRSQLIRLESLMNGGDFPAITAICSSRPYPVLRVNYFDGNLRWIGFDSGTSDPANQGAQEPTPINWPAGAVYFALSANTVDKTTISFSSDV